MVASRRLALALFPLAVLAVLLAPTVAAATVLTMTTPATASQVIRERGQSAFDVAVSLQADGFGCPGPGEFPPVAITVTGAPPGTTVTVEPAELIYTAQQGLYVMDPTGQGLPLPTSAFNQTQNAKVTVANANVSASANVSFTITASFPGGAPAGCEAQTPPEAASATGATIVQLVAPPPPPTPEPVVEDKSFLPAPGFGLALLAVLGIAMLAGRRRRD